MAEGRDAAALRAALAGCDAAVFAIGPSGRTVRSGGSHGDAAEHAGARRGHAAPPPCRGSSRASASGPFTDGDDPFLRYVAKPIVQRILREPFSDFVATEPVVRSSDLDWTIVRPPQLKDGSARGRYRRADDAGVPFGISIRRADLARAVLDVLDDDSTVGATITVAA